MRSSKVLLRNGYDDVDSSHFYSTCILIEDKESNLYTTERPSCFYVLFQTLPSIAHGRQKEFFFTMPASKKTLFLKGEMFSSPPPLRYPN
jgi:hypothetical protein